MSKKKWMMKVNEARELRKQGLSLLFRRVVLLNECYESQEFRDWCAQNNKNELDYLDEELEDAAANFLTLQAVLQHYPKQEDWMNRSLRELIAEVLQSQKANREDTHKRQSWKERALVAEKEIERLRAEIETFKKSLAILGGKAAA